MASLNNNMAHTIFEIEPSQARSVDIHLLVIKKILLGQHWWV